MKNLSIFLLAFLLAGCSSSETLLDKAPHSEDLSLRTESAATKTEDSSVVAPKSVNQKIMYNSEPKMEIDKSLAYEAVLKTSAGEIVVTLNAQETPITVNNFVFLAKNNFYNGVIFHRVIKGFMIQGGDPTGTGSGGPGYQFADEPFTGEYTRGTLAMANAGPDTNGSQFFIMHKDTPLPKDYVIFGKVKAGLEVVDSIAESQTSAGDRPVTPVVIESITINAE